MLIALNGRIGAGKDTVGAYLVENYGFERWSFAGKLKESFAALLDVTVEELEKWKNDPNWSLSINHGTLPRKRMNFRTALQRYGTESHRDTFWPDFWVDVLLPRGVSSEVRYIQEHDVVITDCRFINEAERIKEYGGMVLEVRRPRPSAEIHTLGHISENALPPGTINGIIVNDKDFDLLYTRVDKLMNNLGVERRERKDAV